MIVIGKVCGEVEQPAPVLGDDIRVCFLGRFVRFSDGLLKRVACALGGFAFPDRGEELFPKHMAPRSVRLHLHDLGAVDKFILMNSMRSLLFDFRMSSFRPQ